QDFIPYPGETQFIGFMRANYLHLFPKLFDQSQFHRRARALRFLVERLRQAWLLQLGVRDPKQLLLDTKPIPVLGYKRSKEHSEFVGQAAYGYCAAPDELFRLQAGHADHAGWSACALRLGSTNLDERQAAEVLTQQVRDCDIFGDKGFLSDDWQA